MTEERKSNKGRRFLILAVLIGLGFGALATFRTGPAATIEIEARLPGIGRRTPIQLTFAEPERGLGRLRVELVQGDRVELLAEVEHEPLEAWKVWGHRAAADQLLIEVGSETVEGLREGDAVIRASAARAGTWLRKPGPAIEELRLPVLLRPPVLAVRSSQHYVAQGGSGVVVYSVGASSVGDGVQIGEWWFPGHAMAGSPTERFALFGVPFDLEDSNRILLVAEDSVGNRSSQAFVDRFFEKGFETDTIRISDSFMEKVVPAILAGTPELADKGNLLENYLMLNGELRAMNAETFMHLGERSSESFPWKRAFVSMPNAKVMSSFADRRTYLYDGDVVDHQDHLGFDLASVKRAEIPAANDGVVALARYFGIYGNAVVIDHGYGLMSIYGHLSSIEVAEGESVERGQIVGRSGETGLAGGDHLHFTMLVRGLAVNPVEWWDGAWIRDRVAAKLGATLEFEE